MSVVFFDTSAIVKHYHFERGSSKVDGLLALPGASPVISRLSFVEFHSSFAKKFRNGQITQQQMLESTRRFRNNIYAKKLRVVRLRVAHYDIAVKLIRRIGPTQNLRTLDALQLAVVVSLNEPWTSFAPTKHFAR